jgi:hypothetical protein
MASNVTERMPSATPPTNHANKRIVGQSGQVKMDLSELACIPLNRNLFEKPTVTFPSNLSNMDA